MESHLGQIESYGAEQVSGEVERDGVPVAPPTSLVAQFAERVGEFTTRSLSSLPRLARKDLAAAGMYSVKLEVVEGYRYLAGGAAAALVLLYAVVLSGGLPPLAVVFVLAAAAAGWDLPALIIRRRGKLRLEEIDRQLPDLIDLVIASVETGLSVGAAVALLAERFEAPLGQELRLALQQQQLGTSTAAAMTAFAERAETPTARAFARTISRAEAMGGSIAPVLRNLAVDARRRRRQKANERAAKVPIKLLFPLVLLIFPALFVVLLYPAGYTIARTFGG